MPDNQTSATQPAEPAVTSTPADNSNAPGTDASNKATDTNVSQSSTLIPEVIQKINDSNNVLVALSSDPSVDEMAAAIGLSLFLDKIGKRATAIYSGSTPNALEFLKPEDTFESTADTLQDFVIAINKERADHLRYKLDGDFVKIYITPYRSRISESDLEFSYGDYNVDLVLALDVANGIDLDSALREHGRIMHDASIVNITTGNPGKLGEIEWSDKSASSVSEMLANLIYNMGSDAKIEKDEATAFLTGIVAATDRFSNAKTTAETMRISSLLMESGANQQLISQNITPDIENEMLHLPGLKKKEEDATKLDIEHDEESDKQDVAENSEAKEPTEEKSESKDETENETKDESDSTNDALLDDLKAAEASLSRAGDETVPEASVAPLDVNSPDMEVPVGEPSSPSIASSATTSSLNVPSLAPQEPVTSTPILDSEKVVQPLTPNIDNSFTTEENSNRYGQMLEDALTGIGANEPAPEQAIISSDQNPAVANAPEVPSSPEINSVPDISYAPTTEGDVLPPPPAPPVDFSQDIMPSVPVDQPQPSIEPVPSTPNPSATTAESLGPQPAMQDQVYGPQATDPSAFRIPGM